MESVIVTTESDLEKIISKMFKNQVKNILPEIVKEANAKEWLTKEELMELTGYSSRSIQNLRDTNQIPYAKNGRKIIYNRKAILEWLEEHHIKPQQ